MDEQPIRKPITHLKIFTLNEKYFELVETFMEQHGCTVEYTARGTGSYLFTFPEGTEEVEHQNSTVKKVKQTTIQFPDGLKLLKKEYLPAQEEGSSIVILVLPAEAYGLKLGRKGMTHG